MERLAGGVVGCIFFSECVSCGWFGCGLVGFDGAGRRLGGRSCCVVLFCLWVGVKVKVKRRAPLYLHVSLRAASQ